MPSASFYLKHNEEAWDHLVSVENPWTVPVSSEDIAKAREGNFLVVVTPQRPVPKGWFPDSLDGVKILSLAAAGGQQSPLFAAAGAAVTVLDNSPGQLAQDKLVADRENLNLDLLHGDMADLSRFSDESFDLVFHPCSNTFVPDVKVVYREASRVLKPGGTLIAGFCNPMRWIFEDERHENNNFALRYPLPYSDADSLTEDEFKKIVIDRPSPMEYSHSLEDQLGGQLEAGLTIVGFYEDRYPPNVGDKLSEYLPTFIATRSRKLSG